MAYAITQSPPMGLADLGTVYTAGGLGGPGITVLPSAVLQAQLGQIVQGQDLVAPTGNAVSGGGGEFIFLGIPISTTTTKGLLYYWKGDYTIVVVPTSMSSTVTSGSPLAAALVAASSNATSVQYAWFQIQGRCQLLKTATIAIQPNVPLYTNSATAGRVQASAVTLRTILGIRSANTATAATGASILYAYLNRPVIGPGI